MPPGAGSAGEGRDGALKLGGRGEEDLVTGKNGNGGGVCGWCVVPNEEKGGSLRKRDDIG